MEQAKSASKVPMTFRIAPDRQEKLKALAASQNISASALIESAIEALLSANGEVGTLLTKEDIEWFLPIAEAIGKPITVSLFLTIIQTHRGS